MVFDTLMFIINVGGLMQMHHISQLLYLQINGFKAPIYQALGLN